MAKQFGNLNKGVKNMGGGGLTGLIGGNTPEEKEEDQPQKEVKPKSIILTDVPPNVHRTLKLKATDEGISMSKLILAAVVNFYGIKE